MKTTPCTEKKYYAFNNAPRCGAKTRQGTVCQSPAVKGRPRCRLHGCGGKGSGAPVGNTYAVTHGQTTAELKSFRQAVHKVIKESRELAQELS
jgi:glucans biosynthesis protein